MRGLQLLLPTRRIPICCYFYVLILFFVFTFATMPKIPRTQCSLLCPKKYGSENGLSRHRSVCKIYLDSETLLQERRRVRLASAVESRPSRRESVNKSSAMSTRVEMLESFEADCHTTLAPLNQSVCDSSLKCTHI